MRPDDSRINKLIIANPHTHKYCIIHKAVQEIATKNNNNKTH